MARYLDTNYDQHDTITIGSYLSETSFTQISLLEETDPPSCLMEELPSQQPLPQNDEIQMTHSPVPLHSIPSPKQSRQSLTARQQQAMSLAPRTNHFGTLDKDFSPADPTALLFKSNSQHENICASVDVTSLKLASQDIQPETPSFATDKGSFAHSRRSTTLTLNEQEKTIDVLRKDNFGLKMKIYYLEKRLDELSPDQNDNAIRENIDLKVNIQTLGQELKKYKKMILDLNGAMAILQQRQGMSVDEKREYEEALATADAFRSENEQLQKMIAEQRMENARVRLVASHRLSNKSVPSSPLQQQSVLPSPTSSSSQFHQQSPYQHPNQTQQPSDTDYYKTCWLQSKQTVQEQQHTIHRLRTVIQQHTEAKLNENQHIDQALSQLQQKSKEVRDLLGEREQAARLLDEKEMAREQIESKCRRLDVKSRGLEDRLYQQQDVNKELRETLSQREQDLIALESEVEKLVAHSERLEAQADKARTEQKKAQADFDTILNDKNSTIRSYIQQLEQAQKQQEVELTNLEAKFSTMMTKAMKTKDHDTHSLQQIHEQTKQRYDSDLQLLDSKLQQMEQELREREIQIAQLEGHLEAQQDAMQHEKALYQEDVKDLEDQLNRFICSTSSDGTASTSTMDCRQLREVNERLLKERDSANEALQSQRNNQHLLEQHLQTIRKRNGILTSLLESSESNDIGRLEKTTRLLNKLNQELYQELEDRDNLLSEEKKLSEKLDKEYSKSLQDLRRMEQLLVRRDSMITRTLERIENHKERKEVLENVLRRQATEDVVLRRSMDSVRGF
ncbi:hypothetical protein DM01DRAFT_1176181 [Hesseltinella vesiculosa]|uniref:Centrosomin N-terminal motif 1 domain-containing protein n=1 Tax=Hesseltinella vesiculosa TaxID=101127 RepID=A0A1X2G4Z2_9FUNG|nr:hypothetical protein DM01DRAFT_1176181 [Hesseltinella vesiculosa]